MTKRVAIYCRVSTADQHPETQLYDLREMARLRGYEIVQEYSDTISGAKSKRPGLDQLLADGGDTGSMSCWLQPSIEWPAASATFWKSSTS